MSPLPCFHCGQARPVGQLVRCSACRAAVFCGTACASADWRAGTTRHRRWCRALAAPHATTATTAAVCAAAVPVAAKRLAPEGGQRAARRSPAASRSAAMLADYDDALLRLLDELLAWQHKEGMVDSQDSEDSVELSESLKVPAYYKRGLPSSDQGAGDLDYRGALLRLLSPLQLYTVYRFLVERALLASDVLVATQPVARPKGAGRRVKREVQGRGCALDPVDGRNAVSVAKADVRRLRDFEDMLQRRKLWLLQYSTAVAPDLRSRVRTLGGAAETTLEGMPVDVFLILLNRMWRGERRTGRIARSLRRLLKRDVGAYLAPNRDYEAEADGSGQGVQDLYDRVRICFFDAGNILSAPLGQTERRRRVGYAYVAEPLPQKRALYESLRRAESPDVEAHVWLARVVAAGVKALAQTPGARQTLASGNGLELWTLLTTPPEDAGRASLPRWQQEFTLFALAWLYGSPDLVAQKVERLRGDAARWAEFATRVRDTLGKSAPALAENKIVNMLKYLTQDDSRPRRRPLQRQYAGREEAIKKKGPLRVPLLLFLLERLAHKQLALMDALNIFDKLDRGKGGEQSTP